MADQSSIIVDWARFGQAKQALGHNFWRVLRYFREDGGAAVSAIEDGMRAQRAMAMIGPADLLKSEAIQMGALSVAELAEDIEMQARDCIEMHQAPDTLLEAVIALRAAFEQTVASLEQRASPLVSRTAQPHKKRMCLSDL
jgi:histidine phosphotransfer protein HptB